MSSLTPRVVTAGSVTLVSYGLTLDHGSLSALPINLDVSRLRVKCRCLASGDLELQNLVPIASQGVTHPSRLKRVGNLEKP